MWLHSGTSILLGQVPGTLLMVCLLVGSGCLDLHLCVLSSRDFSLLSSSSCRINNDLLMWEPPPPAAHSPERSRHHHDEFQLCKSAFRLGELPPGRLLPQRGGETSRLRRHLIGSCSREAPPLVSPTDSDSEEDEPRFYLASKSSGRTQQSAPRPKHNLSLLSLTVMIGKGRLQARTDKKVSRPPL